MRSPPHVLLVTVLLAGCGPSSPTTIPTAEPKPSAKNPTSAESPSGGCHPGCFPAGTPVLTPAGWQPVQTIRAGETVTLIAADGRKTSGPVVAVFDTCNQLVEVRTDGGTLTTTAKQPLCLESGECKPAGELAAGDVIWRWADGRRQAVRVIGMTATDRHEPVYNLVVGEWNVFVAGEFLARGKPPAER